jgi:oligoendopeptidase F
MAGKTIPHRDQTPREHKWDLTALFQSDKAWETEFVDVEKQLPSYRKYKGHLKDSVLSLKEAIEFHLRLNRQIEALYTYAHLKSDEDKSNQLYLGFQQRALNLLTRCAEMSSFMTPEIQSIPDETIDQFMEDPSVAEFKFYLEKFCDTNLIPAVKW